MKLNSDMHIMSKYVKITICFYTGDQRNRYNAIRESAETDNNIMSLLLMGWTKIQHSSLTQKDFKSQM